MATVKGFEKPRLACLRHGFKDSNEKMYPFKMLMVFPLISEAA